MVELEKRVSGDWIELRTKANDLYSLLDHLAIDPQELRGPAETLRHCVEQGIIEFKRVQLSPVLVTLETARYKTLAVPDLVELERLLTALLFVILVQRLLAADLHPLSRAREAKPSFGIDDMEVNVILADVNVRIKGNPALRAHPAIKNILMQVQLYNRENQKMRELLPTIKPEMRTAFLANFTRTFDEIIGSIRRHYALILEEQLAVEKARVEGFSLALIPLKDLAPLLANQARELSQIRSSLAFAREDKYKTREVLVRLYDSRHDMLRLIEEESKVYHRICKRTLQYDLDGCSRDIANGFRDEIALILEKQGKKEV